MMPFMLSHKRKEINIILCHEDFVNILCYGYKQDKELLEVIRKKFILTPRAFKGYVKLLPYTLVKSAHNTEVIDMGCIVRIKKIEIVTRPGFNDLHEIVVGYLDGDNGWEIISEFNDKRIIICDVKTHMLRFNKHKVGYPRNVISACKVFGFV